MQRIDERVENAQVHSAFDLQYRIKDSLLEAGQIDREGDAEVLPVPEEADLTCFRIKHHAENCSDDDWIILKTNVILPLIRCVDLASLSIQTPDVLLRSQVLVD